MVHSSVSREQLLVGNRGQYFHIGLGQIALMVPGTSWIWPVLRSQLLDQAGKPTLGARRLSAALVAEAVKMGRTSSSAEKVDWDEIATVMGAADCERYVEFYKDGIERDRTLLLADGAGKSDDHGPWPVVVELIIKADGPFVSALPKG